MKEKDESGKPIIVEEEIVLNKICSNALMQPDQKDDGAKKVEKYLLAQKVHNADEVELTVEEISLLKECIAVGYAPLVVGQAWCLLEKGVQ